MEGDGRHSRFVTPGVELLCEQPRPVSNELLPICALTLKLGMLGERYRHDNGDVVAAMRLDAKDIDGPDVRRIPPATRRDEERSSTQQDQQPRRAARSRMDQAARVVW